MELTNAHGLLKAELRALGSLLLPCADQARVPAGAALAVDRDQFSRAVHERVTAHPRITVRAGGSRGRCRLPASWRRDRSPRIGSADASASGSAARRWHSTTPSPRSSPPTRSTTSGSTRSPDTARVAETTTSTHRSTGKPTRLSSPRWSRPTSSAATTSTRCPTSRGACRSRRWLGGDRRHCASVP